MSKRITRAFLRVLAIGAAAAVLLACLSALAFCAADRMFPYPSGRLDEAQKGGATFIEDRNGELVAWRVGPDDQWRLRVKLEEVCPRLIQATIAAEDFRFETHPGVDPLAVARAAGQNALSGRRISGASTLTMQAVRLVKPGDRNYPNKLIEAFRALQMERRLSKNDILETYFSLAPYGGNVVGAEAAARRYFGKRAAALTLGQAALLAGVPQRPSAFNPAKNLPAALKRREFVLDRMLALGMITADEAEAARREAILAAGDGPNRLAPHFAEYAIQECGFRAGVVKTTLDSGVQEIVLGEVGGHWKDLASRGIDGVAAVVVDVGTGELLAMVGSAAPDDPLTGFVNAAASRRQPGSLLKPFIYAAAFEDGTLTPASVVYDVLGDFQGYRPRNMDLEYLGPISVSRALQLSRNVPAVRALERLGPGRLEADMNLLGLDVGDAARRCGLSLALGTEEVRLVDIAGAYAALARLGKFLPVKALLNGRQPEPARVYSEGAAYLALRALGAPAGEGPGRPVFKTGTSWNHRDAWAVAMDPDLVVAVWCGGLSGGGHPSLTGAGAALPLALRILGGLTRGSTKTWRRPAEVGVRPVCALSGAPPCGACGEAISAEYLPGRSSEAPCSLHRFEGQGDRRRQVTIWPGQAGPGAEKAPASAAGASLGAVRITSPAQGGEYFLGCGNAEEGSLLRFEASCAGCKGPVYWFLDGELLASQEVSKPVEWLMKPGRHELIVSAGAGGSASIGFTVVKP